jgi:ankyrin repeat protein
LDLKREDVALELIERVADVELENSEERTPLLVAYHQNLSSAAHEIALRVTDLEVSDIYGMTAMLEAAENASLEIVHMLIGRGGSIRVIDGNGCSVFHMAIIGGNLEVAEFFLTQFQGLFLVNDRDPDGDQPLHLAAVHGKSSAAQWLVDKGAKNAPGMEGRTPLIYAASYGAIVCSQGSCPSRS